MNPLLATSLLQSEAFIYVLYIVAFALFIQGLRGLSGPTTAVRGNRTAAVGMAIAVIATLLDPGEGNWGLIALGIALGAAVGMPAARNVKMTAMPQMVALFNGVGGGAVALIAWVEFRHYGSTYGSHTVHFFGESGSADDHRRGPPTYVAIFSVFAAIVGSISFWGSNIAFGKLQEVIPGRPISLRLRPAGGQPRAADPRARCRHRPDRRARTPKLLFIGMLVVAALLGNAVVLPIGGADMPVVISMLNAFTGLSAAATGMALDNPALIVAGMIVGASGSILTKLMADGDEPLDPRDRRRRLRRRRRGRGRLGRGRARGHGALHHRRRRCDPARLRQPRCRSCPATGWRSRRPSTPCASWPSELEHRGRGRQIRDPPGRGADAGAHERAARGGRRAV